MGILLETVKKSTSSKKISNHQKKILFVFAKMGCCDQISKYIIFLFNLVFFLVSLVLIGSGVALQVMKDDIISHFNSVHIEDIDPNQMLLIATITLISIGGVILLISFCGCCGSIIENKCMVLTYATILALITLSLIGAGVAIHVLEKNIKEELKKELPEILSKQDVVNAFNGVQTSFECCGVFHYTDWNNKAVFGINDVPDSCCKTQTLNCGQNVGNEEEAMNVIYTTGCFNKLEQTYWKPALLVGVGAIVLLMTGVIMSCCFGIRINKKKYDSVY